MYMYLCLFLNMQRSDTCRVTTFGLDPICLFQLRTSHIAHKQAPLHGCHSIKTHICLVRVRTTQCAFGSVGHGTASILSRDTSELVYRIP